MDISKSSVLVTGGASGLGAATVRALVAAGAFVTIFDFDKDKSISLAQELGSRVTPCVGDVSSENDVSDAFLRTESIAPLRLVVNCAGVGYAARTLSRDGLPHNLDDFERVIKVNLIGTFNVLRLGAKTISRVEPADDGERGVIITTASVAAYEGQIGQVAYSASKGGIVAMTLPAARDLSPLGIRVVGIAPGIMDTPLLGQLPPEVKIGLGAVVPFPRRLGLTSEYASLVLEIARNRYLNGEVIRLDGALRMAPK